MSFESNYTVAMLTLSLYPPPVFIILRADMLTSYRTNATPVAANDSVQRITVFCRTIQAIGIVGNSTTALPQTHGPIDTKIYAGN